MDDNPYQPPQFPETSQRTPTGNSGKFTALFLGLPIIIFILSNPLAFFHAIFVVIYQVLSEVLAIFSLEQA